MDFSDDGWDPGEAELADALGAEADPPDAGAREAFVAGLGDVFRRHRDKVYQTCHRVVGNAERAEELTNDAFAVGCERWWSYDGSCLVSTWLCGIGRFLAYNDVRKKRAVPVHHELLDGFEDSAARNALRDMARAERDRVIAQATATLSPLDQRIYHLRYVERLQRRAVARLTDLDLDAVRASLARIKRRVGAELKRLVAALGRGPSVVLDDPR